MAQALPTTIITEPIPRIIRPGRPAKGVTNGHATATTVRVPEAREKETTIRITGGEVELKFSGKVSVSINTHEE